MPGGTHIHNEIGLRRTLAGTEAIAGVAVAPDYRWRGDLSISKNAPLVRTPERTGGYDALVVPVRELPTFDGTYSERLTYQSLAQHNQYAIKAGSEGVTAGSGFRYAVSPSVADDDIATATLQYGVDGQVWQSTGVRHNEYNISIDTESAEDVWMLQSQLFVREKTQVVGFEGVSTAGDATTLTDSAASWTVDEWAGSWVFLDFGTGSGQVRQVVSNTATVLTFYGPALSPAAGVGVVYRIEGLFEAGVAFAAGDAIRASGTRLYIDLDPDDIGTNWIEDRFISFNLTVANALATKRFMEHTDGFSARTGRGSRIISGQVRLEFDRRDEYEQYENMTEVALRVQQTGPALSGTPGDEMEATIDVPRAVWDVVDMNERENNITATFGFVAYLPAADPILTIDVVNDLEDLP